MMSVPTIPFADGPLCPELRDDEVHLWRAHLDTPAFDGVALLSPDEWLRAGRFHFERDRRRYIASHGLLRTILGRYTGIAPDELGFTAGEFGKPLLSPNFRDLRFNLSHSGELMLLAVSRAREVGVDLECMREDVPYESLAAHYFPAGEAWQIRTSPPAERAGLFYTAWTLTEARLKAVGTGFSAPSTIIAPDRWSLRSLTPASGYAAAVAVEGEGFELACWAWPS